LSKNTLIIFTSHGNTLQPHGRKRNSIAVKGHMTRSFPKDKPIPQEELWMKKDPMRNPRRKNKKR